MSETMELDCPNCKEKLEIDRGFAGGVCRCFQCGTLMTVPADPARERAETLRRPDRPDAPGGKPSGPAPASTPQRPATPRGAPPPPARPTAPLEAGTYVTESGKTITINKGTKVPMASRKKKVVRATTYAILIAIMAIVAAAIIAAVAVLNRGAGGSSATTQQTPEEQATETLSFNPYANPFTLAEANVVGLPLGAKTAIVLDTSGGSRNWMALIKESLKSAVDKLDDKHALQVVLAREDAPVAEPAGLTTLGKPQRESLKVFIESAQAAGVAPLMPAIDKALAGKPKQIILITSQTPEAAQVQAMGEALAKDLVILDVLLIDQDVSALDRLAQDRGGRYVSMPLNRLSRWYAETKSGGDAPGPAPQSSAGTSEPAAATQP